MARLRILGAAAPLLVALGCSIPVAEAPPEEQARVDSAADFDSPIDPSVRPEDLPFPVEPTAAELQAYSARVRRLSPAEFPEIPPSLGKTLVDRECLIPQADSGGPLGNLIRGEFFAKGQESWAVICSHEGRSQILAFRSADDPQPDLIEESDDPICLGEPWNCGMLYGTNISPVGRDYILSHYQAYGGPAPPPIEHQGIDVGIWEKGSVVRYFHNGVWLSLTGAD